jgi:hypothetical protein
MRIPRLRLVRCLLLMLSAVVARQAAAQVASIDSVAVRRTAIFSALVSRATREGVVLRVGLCSVVRSIGVGQDLRGSAPAAIGASLVGEESATCPARGGGQPSGPWVVFGEVLGARIAGPAGGGLPAVTVALRVWEGPGTYADEVYDFIVSPDDQWAPVKYQWQGRGYINLARSRESDTFVLLNGKMVTGMTGAEMLNRIRGQVVDSVRVVPANDSAFTAMYGSMAARGGVIIGTHPPRRRP